MWSKITLLEIMSSYLNGWPPHPPRSKYCSPYTPMYVQLVHPQIYTGNTSLGAVACASLIFYSSGTSRDASPTTSTGVFSHMHCVPEASVLGTAMVSRKRADNVQIWCSWIFLDGSLTTMRTTNSQLVGKLDMGLSITVFPLTFLTLKKASIQGFGSELPLPVIWCHHTEDHKLRYL